MGRYGWYFISLFLLIGSYYVVWKYTQSTLKREIRSLDRRHSVLTDKLSKQDQLIRLLRERHELCTLKLSNDCLKPKAETTGPAEKTTKGESTLEEEINRSAFGPPVTLNHKNVPVREVLVTLALHGNQNIVIDEDIKGDTDIHLDNIPWKLAYRELLLKHDLRESWEDGINYVFNNWTRTQYFETGKKIIDAFISVLGRPLSEGPLRYDGVYEAGTFAERFCPQGIVLQGGRNQVLRMSNPRITKSKYDYTHPYVESSDLQYYFVAKVFENSIVRVEEEAIRNHYYLSESTNLKFRKTDLSVEEACDQSSSVSQNAFETPTAAAQWMLENHELPMINDIQRDFQQILKNCSTGDEYFLISAYGNLRNDISATLAIELSCTGDGYHPRQIRFQIRRIDDLWYPVLIDNW